MTAHPRLDRFESLDVLRGLAVLGILMVNVQAFAMYNTAYQYPLAHMDFTGANQAAWLITHVFFEMKFITIFSALFGAGIVLMVGDEPGSSLKVHYRRMLWLLAIGLIHAYVFWFGDILTSYALVGMLAVLARRMKPLGLTLFGIALIALSGLLTIGLFASFNLMPGELDAMQAGMAPTAEQLASVTASYQAGFVDRMGYNALYAAMFQLSGLVMFGGRLIGVMFLGMALYKWGFLTARWGMGAYIVAAFAGLGFGLPLAWWGGEYAIASEFALGEMWKHMGGNYAASLLVAFGYASVVMLVCKIAALQMVRAPFAAVGRMAFTNYLTQTLVMTFIFVGPPGLGLFGEIERAEQVQIVVLVWLAQLIISPVWLHFFRFGPMEWVWRSLTYGKLQPFRRGKDEAVPV